MQPADLDPVLVIERGFSAPWTREMFGHELRPADNANHRVALVGAEIVGYVLWWYVADEVHIVNLAVAPAHRRRGIARLLLTEVFGCGRAGGMTIATLEVRAHNEAAIGLYESSGFRTVAIRKSYYADNGEDALVMVKDL
jgi:ribosomal-protein-alanine N-acetyltransferase